MSECNPYLVATFGENNPLSPLYFQAYDGNASDVAEALAQLMAPEFKSHANGAGPVEVQVWYHCDACDNHKCVLSADWGPDVLAKVKADLEGVSDDQIFERAAEVCAYQAVERLIAKRSLLAALMGR